MAAVRSGSRTPTRARGIRSSSSSHRFASTGSSGATTGGSSSRACPTHCSHGRGQASHAAGVPRAGSRSAGRTRRSRARRVSQSARRVGADAGVCRRRRAARQCRGFAHQRIDVRNPRALDAIDRQHARSRERRLRYVSRTISAEPDGWSSAGSGRAMFSTGRPARKPRRTVRASARCMASARTTVMPHVPDDRSGSRWIFGVAADRALPLRSVLIAMDVFAERYSGLAAPVDWTTEVGVRRQLTPRTVIESTLGRRFTGAESGVVSRDWRVDQRGGATPHPGDAMINAGRASVVVRWCGGLSLCAIALGACAYYPQTYFPAAHNWVFRDQYPNADRLFNAFDYGHAVLSELLYTRGDARRASWKGASSSSSRQRICSYVPRVSPLDGGARRRTTRELAPEIHEMFEWAHMLHRQIYDVWADNGIPKERRMRSVSAGDAVLQARPASRSAPSQRTWS